MKRIVFLILAVLCLSVGCSQEDATDLWSENIYPSTNNTYDIGSPILQYQDGYFVNVWASNNVVATNNMTATYFIGDGSLLTGIEQGELILYFLDTASPDVAGQKRLSSDYNDTEVTLTEAGLGDGNTLMGTWITDVGVPAKNLLTGNFRVHVTGVKTGGTKNVQFFYEIYKCDEDGVEIELLSTSEYTNILTAVRTDYRIWVLLAETNLNTSDRIKVKGYAFVSGGGSAPDVEAYIQGVSNTRLVLPVGAVSVENFMPYVGAVNDFVTAYDIRGDDIIADDDIWCDATYTRIIGLESSVYHTGDADTYWHFDTDELYIIIDGFKVVEFLNESTTFYNNVSMNRSLTIAENIDVGGYIANGNMSIRADGTIAPVSMADASATNNSIYFSTDGGVLSYKDSTGTVHGLY